MSHTTTAAAPTSSQLSTQSAARQSLDEPFQLVSFMVGAQEYAIPILSVQEINRMLPISPDPQSLPFIEGVINLRGRIIPIMDLRKRFGTDVREHDNDSRIIVTEVQNRAIGFTVDRVNQVLSIDSALIQPPSATAAGVNAEYVRGVGQLNDRLLILLDLAKLLGDSDLRSMDQANSASTSS